MAIYFKTSDPEKLLQSFKKKIDDKSILTWSYDRDDDFTHTTSQWEKLAWLRPRKQNGKLAFFIVAPRNSKISTTTYAIYHGRFIESMLAHCDSLFNEAIATAMIDGEDAVG